MIQGQAATSTTGTGTTRTRRGSLQGLFKAMAIIPRRGRDLPNLPTFLPSSQLILTKALQPSTTNTTINNNEIDIVGKKVVEVKRTCIPDPRAILLLSPLYDHTTTQWTLTHTHDAHGLHESFHLNQTTGQHLRGCCSASKSIFSCCSLCSHDNWIWQGSQYNPRITLLYAQNDACLPAEVQLLEPKFIIPWRYKNRRTSAITWKVVHMCGSQMEDAECETIVVNVNRDGKLRRVLEAVGKEARWYDGAEKVEYLLRVVRLCLGSYGCQDGPTSAQADASLYAQMVKQGHNFMLLCSVKIGLCRHKSLLFKILCDSVGLECSLITGYSTGGRHQWNIISLPDEFGVAVNYIIDATSSHFSWTKEGSKRMKAYKIKPEESFGHGGLTLLRNMRPQLMQYI